MYPVWGGCMDDLKDVQCRQAKYEPGGKNKLTDGGGLYLHLMASGKYWRIRYEIGGKENTYSAGVYPAVSLTQAREVRAQVKALLRQGLDPNKHKQAQRLQTAEHQENTFEAVATRWYDQWKIGKASYSTVTKWTRLERDIFPWFGKLPIRDVTAPMIVTAVEAVNARGARDTAERIQSICSQVFRYAIAKRLAERNPAADIRTGDFLPDKVVQNRARVSAKELPELLRAIHGYRGERMTVIGLQLLCLTFVRTGDLVGAVWDEFDFDNATWTIPGGRLKKIKGRVMDDHVVPLSDQAMALFKQMQTINGHQPYVFYSTRSTSRRMSDGTMLQALYRMGYRGIMTGHGFRGLASTVMHEAGFQHEHIDAQLAHKKQDKVSAAYDHSKYLAQRIDLMAWWGNYVDNCTKDKIITLPRRATG